MGLLRSYYLEDFNGYSYGDVYPNDTHAMGPVNGFSYDLYAFDGLWAGDGNMSTNNSASRLDIRMTGDPVYAVGGLFFASDSDGVYMPVETTLILGDGTTHTFLPDDPYGAEPSFVGYISTVPIVNLAIDARDDSAYGAAWSTVDDLYVGSLIPAPTSIVLLGAVVSVSHHLRRRTAIVQ